MEYTQWVQQETNSHQLCSSLNPCCNGIYSMRKVVQRYRYGTWVLILVVMEYTQWGARTEFKICSYNVLILVVMEYTQWESRWRNICWRWKSLNPCCNGIYSMSRVIAMIPTLCVVLILVVMEYTQWVRGFVAQEDGT